MKVFSSHLPSTFPEDLAFVPTMGALHEGHLSIIRAAKKKSQHVLVSIFVNPIQFSKNEDYQRYPKQEEKDLKLLEKEGIFAVFLPKVTDLYPSSNVAKVQIFAKRWCAARRKGHFDGVCSVLLRFIHLLKPHSLFLGEKDFQQYLMVKKMLTDFFIPIQLYLVPTVRDSKTGLALSSRNAYLDDLKRASRVYETLKLGLLLFRSGIVSTLVLRQKMLAFLKEDPLFQLDYLGFVDSETLMPVSQVSLGNRMLIAVFFQGVRLIDNQVFDS